MVVKSYEPTVAHYCRSLSRFSYYKATNSIATPPGWDASPSQAFQAFRQFSLTVCWYLFIFLGGESHCESKVSCPRTQNNYSARA